MELLQLSYKDVCTGKTGHTEAIEISYDEKIKLEDILKSFLAHMIQQH